MFEFQVFIINYYVVVGCSYIQWCGSICFDDVSEYKHDSLKESDVDFYVFGHIITTISVVYVLFHYCSL